jgi:hypothetical protein
MGRRTFAAQVMWIGIWACAMRSSAQAPEGLRVERGPGAETCPDAPELNARIETIRGQPSATGRTYSVAFRHEGHNYFAELRADADGSSRRSLATRADDCKPLAQATAVTLALLYDTAPPSPSPERRPEPVLRPPPPPTAASIARPAPIRCELGAAIGAGVSAGVIRPWAPVLLGELGVRYKALHLGLGVAWLPQQRLALSSGSSELSLIAGDARACYAIVRRPWLRLEGCSGVLLGSLSAAASGYTSVSPRSSHTYAALPLELTLGQGVAHASWEVSAALLLPYRRNQFEIEGLGRVYDAPAISALLTLRAAGWLEL